LKVCLLSSWQAVSFVPKKSRPERRPESREETPKEASRYRYRTAQIASESI
jgi:hypothetical protein